MFNKKSMGLHWDVLLISLFVSIGILYYAIASVNIPKVGKISLETVKTLEKNDIIPSIIERVMKWINEMTIKDLDGNKIFKLRSYCDEDYKQKIEKNKQRLNGGFMDLEGELSNCTIDEEQLKAFFETIFEAKYNNFKKEDFGTIDLSKTIYASSIGKEDKYFNIVNTSNGIDVPINIEKKQIGKFNMKPVFKLSVDYTFDDKNKEVCILSKDCGAVCDDVIARYSGEIEFRKKDYSCSEYFFCADVFPDDFGLNYPCDANFCMESGTYDTDGHDIVCPDCHCLGDWYYIESCNPYGVAQYLTQQQTCKHEGICPDSMKFREVYDCCGYSYQSCGCGGEPCCIQLDYCSCGGATQCGVCGNPDCPPPPPPPPPPEPEPDPTPPEYEMPDGW